MHVLRADYLIGKVICEDNNLCWLWPYAKDNHGYGSLMYDGQKTRAHVVAYETRYGSIPIGKEIDHLCKNKPCYNPRHLEAVTRSENVLRTDNAGGNKLKTHCPQGHQYDAIKVRNGRIVKRICTICLRESQYRHNRKRTAEGYYQEYYRIRKAREVE